MSFLQVLVHRRSGAVLADMLQLPTCPPCTVQCIVAQHVRRDQQIYASATAYVPKRTMPQVARPLLSFLDHLPCRAQGCCTAHG